MPEDLQQQLDDLRARLEELENQVYGPEEESEGPMPGPGRTKASPGLAILIGKKGKE